MLKPIVEFDIDTRLAALYRGWIAICPETGAFLSRSSGRSKSSNGHKYILILPNEKPDARNSYFDSYSWEDKNRKSIRAWSDDKALIIANNKLSKLIERS